ncbi:MAG TPA: winged helix-turn-helix transcriptional regulator, partial [Candidatus Thermoplasmatota archaeon]|nr:winged helix-turn-helix transcriptional regulator [Candidatus Thermoplasmatota archaeon]
SSAAYVALDLATGATRHEVAGVQRVGVPQAVPERVEVAGFALAAPAPAPQPAALTPAAVGAGAAAAGLLALLVLAAAKGWLAALYSRLTRRQVLDAPARAAILELVRQEPGIHASALLERLGKAHGVGEYHLAVLEREGFLTSVRTAGFRRCFVTGAMTHAEMRAVAALRDGQAEKLYRIIEATPGIHLTDLAARAGLTLPYVSRQVKALAEAGLVDKVQTGRAVALYPVLR